MAPLGKLEAINQQWQQQQQQQIFEQAKGMQSMSPAMEPATSPADEYAILVSRTGLSSPVTAKDAAAMQVVVDSLRKDPTVLEVSIYKRMLRYRTKVEWETMDTDL